MSLYIIGALFVLGWTIREDMDNKREARWYDVLGAMIVWPIILGMLVASLVRKKEGGEK